MEKGSAVTDRVQPEGIRRDLLLAEVGYLCPRCGGDLCVKKGRRRSICAQAAHIYPLKPTLYDLEALEGIEPPNDPNDDSNFIMLCPSCHVKFDNPRTKDDYLALRKLKDDLSAAREVKLKHSSYSLEAEIWEVIRRLSECDNESEEKLSVQALKVDKKLLPDFDKLLARSIKMNVMEYYPTIRHYFEDVDRNSPGSFQCIAAQVRSFYFQMTRILGAEHQEKIFEAVIDWIAAKAEKEESRKACEIVAAFFVQDCEVFENVSEQNDTI